MLGELAVYAMAAGGLIMAVSFWIMVASVAIKGSAGPIAARGLVLGFVVGSVGVVHVVVSMSKTDLLILVIVLLGGTALITIPLLMSDYIKGKWPSYHRRPPPQNSGFGSRKYNETQGARRQGQTGRSKRNRAFAARPAGKRTWREVLGFKEGEKPTIHEVNSAWRRLAKSAHPDIGGTDAQMMELNAALSEARRELQHQPL